MTEGFQTALAANDEERRDLFVGVAASCMVPEFDGAYFSHPAKEALWARYFIGAPARQRQSVERYSIVKRA